MYRKAIRSGLFPALIVVGLGAKSLGCAHGQPDSLEPDKGLDGAVDASSPQDVSGRDWETEEAEKDALLESGCGANESRCGENCIDVSANANHCGACDHSCQQGSCQAGVCQPWPVATQQPQRGLLVADSDGAYWAIQDGMIGCPLTGCPSTGPQYYVEAAPDISSAVIVAGRLFWSRKGPSGAIYQCQLQTCLITPSQLASGQYNALAVLAFGDSLYWLTSPSPGTSGRVLSCLMDGCGDHPAQLSAISAGTAISLAVNSESIYYSVQRDVVLGGSIYRCPLSGCPGLAPTIASSLSYPKALVANETSLYWLEPGQPGATDGVIMRCPEPACESGPQVFIDQQAYPSSLALDKDWLYWTNQQQGTILRCPVSGCASGPTVLAANQSYPSAIGLTETSIYWLNQSDGSVMRLAK